MKTGRIIFFGINFAISAGFALACAVGVGESLAGRGSPGSFLGGVCFFWPALAFAIAEWCLYVRSVRRLEKPLGAVCGAVGLLPGFAFFSSLAEAAKYGNSPGVRFWVVFGTVCVTLSTYCLLCCWCRILHGSGSGDSERLRGRCRQCGYDLTGNVSGVCPECGQPVEPVARST